MFIFNGLLLIKSIKSVIVAYLDNYKFQLYNRNFSFPVDPPAKTINILKIIDISTLRMLHLLKCKICK